MQDLKKTIVAISTAPVKAAISIIRLSGQDAFSIINKLIKFDINQRPANSFKLLKIYDIKKTQLLDEVVVLVYKKPNSFTGENMIEINCHGGVYLTYQILQNLIAAGACLALKGEFLQRAWFNNKINLIQAESINALIEAKNEFQHQTSLKILEHKSLYDLDLLSERVNNLIAQIEINIDYPEYEEAIPIRKPKILSVIDEMLKITSKIIDESEKIIKLNKGIKIAIIGAPNVGKSSLLNALVNEEKAIVSKYKGTTRDIIEGEINLRSLTLRLLDSAGIRQTKNKIELIGIKKAKHLSQNADLVLLVIDGLKMKKEKEINSEILQFLEDQKIPFLVVLNKKDLFNINDFQIPDFLLKYQTKNRLVFISSLKKDLDELLNWIENAFILENIQLKNTNLEFLQTNHQLGILKQINNILKETKMKEEIFEYYDLLAEPFHEIFDKINQLYGRNVKTDIVDFLFRNYCLGK
ncbi:tRNA uridine-5-carboxymethylaminomethyl(34) synthesis GTPase MnmE [Mycoplasma sp. SG1]|uniref:tRNA uridine-5-carboxymethylaminomethyl(34) synthesis GTPase MnmE n=1 Tax=Mycoplasma sp. SG1 TaxID=2810348 RepID=UPI002024B3A5|nr:tRNA uridine-5-carboxymethylaminomethyl(34) synthesis GTPase MnmE [Mycoplasma sp. SG1]URM52833.1 tRNA uridine-5-carboxymethylaminomethyl(34) synthesis GTPase MnmE [Mycoplasma sp. SG1]